MTTASTPAQPVQHTGFRVEQKVNLRKWMLNPALLKCVTVEEQIYNQRYVNTMFGKIEVFMWLTERQTEGKPQPAGRYLISSA